MEKSRFSITVSSFLAAMRIANLLFLYGALCAFGLIENGTTV
jgi:hypothetical protein